MDPSSPPSGEHKRPPQSSEEVHRLLTASLLEAVRQREAEEAARPSTYVAEPDAFYRSIEDPKLGEKLQSSNYFDFSNHVDDVADLDTARKILKEGRSILSIQSSERDTPMYLILRPSDVRPGSPISTILDMAGVDASDDEEMNKMVIIADGGDQSTRVVTFDQAPAVQAMLR